MPKKRDDLSTYGQKFISLFARLLFSMESHSLTDLARMLKCSKQTVLRLVQDIERAYLVNIEHSFKGNRKYYRPGTIDYTPHQNTVCTIIEAMEKQKICNLNYRLNSFPTRTQSTSMPAKPDHPAKHTRPRTSIHSWPFTG